MDWPIAPGTVALGTGDRPPTSGVPGECSSGDPGGSPVVLPTEIAAAMMNVLYLELINLIQVAGLTNTNADLGQVAEAVQALTANPPHGSLSYTFGSGTWTPPANVRSVRYRLWGAGGGGGGAQDTTSSGSSGAGGCYAEGLMTVTPGTGVSFSIGAGGAAGAAGGAGGAGGNSTFGSVTANGGGAGGGGTTGGASGVVSVGGTGSGASIIFPGSNGGLGYSGTAPGAVGGLGGCSGLGGSPGPNVASVGHAGVFPGGGGNGSSANGPGGAGAGGILLLSW